MSTPTRWPDASAYAVAARESTSFFQREELQSAALRTSPLGLPLPATGRNAAVFKATVSDEDIAVRVFTRPPSDGPERYRLVREHIELLGGAVFPDVEWCADAVSVEGASWPMVRMEWVEGVTLDLWVEAHLAEAGRLRSFVERWDELFVYLDHCEVAHGDLQHGNVLVDSDDRVRLVDLDGIWIPALKDNPAPEFGHVHFQHPGRATSRFWGRRMDSFAALLIGVSIEALSYDPTLWDRRNDGGNNLIFLADDFEDLNRPIWHELAAFTDPRLSHRVEKLRWACVVACDRLVGPLEMLDDAQADPAIPGVPGWLQSALATEGSQPPPDAPAQTSMTSTEETMPIWMVAAGAMALIIATVALLVWVV